MTPFSLVCTLWFNLFKLTFCLLGGEPLFTAMLKIANFTQEEMYRPRASEEEEENTSIRGTQRLYILTLILWAIVGTLDDRIRAQERKTRSSLLSRLPWHNLVAHLPALHRSLGSLYEILVAEHTGEHSLRPYANLSEYRSSHHGNFLQEARIATHYQEEFRERFGSLSDYTKTQSLHRNFCSVLIPNIYIPSCCCVQIPLLLANLPALHHLFSQYGWEKIINEHEGGFLFCLSTVKTVAYTLCMGPVYGCFIEHNIPIFP
jgi:hypothetical protein